MGHTDNMVLIVHRCMRLCTCDWSSEVMYVLESCITELTQAGEFLSTLAAEEQTARHTIVNAVGDHGMCLMLVPLQAVGVFLDSTAPATLITDIDALTTAFSTFKANVSALTQAITDFTTAKGAMDPYLTTLVGSRKSDMSGKLDVMYTDLSSVQLALAGVTDWSSAYNAGTV